MRRIRPDRQLPWSYRFVATLLRLVMQPLTRRDWRGAEHLPRTGGFVVSPNHLSYADPIAFAHFLYDNGHPPFFLAKDSVFRIPVLGRMLAHAEQIPVYRRTSQATEAFRSAVDAVHEGKCVPIFPEGTLTRDPDLWPMTGKTGAARVALTTGCPLVPVAQWGPQELLAPYADGLRLLPRKTMHVWAGPPVDLADLQGRPLTREVLGEATDRAARRDHRAAGADPRRAGAGGAVRHPRRRARRHRRPPPCRDRPAPPAPAPTRGPMR